MINCNQYHKSNKYQGGINENFMKELLHWLLPKCDQCGNTKLHICVQEICKLKQPICYNCTNSVNSMHFLHKSNQIRLMLLNQQILTSNYDNPIQLQDSNYYNVIQDEINKLVQKIKELTGFINFLQNLQKKLIDFQQDSKNICHIREVQKIIQRIDPNVIKKWKISEKESVIEKWSNEFIKAIKKIDLQYAFNIIKIEQELQDKIDQQQYKIDSISTITQNIYDSLSNLFLKDHHIQGVMIKKHMHQPILINTNTNTLFNDCTDRIIQGNYQNVAQYTPSKLKIINDTYIPIYGHNPILFNTWNEVPKPKNLFSNDKNYIYRLNELIQELEQVNITQMSLYKNILPHGLKCLSLKREIPIDLSTIANLPKNLIVLKINFTTLNFINDVFKQKWFEKFNQIFQGLTNLKQLQIQCLSISNDVRKFLYSNAIRKKMRNFIIQPNCPYIFTQNMLSKNKYLKLIQRIQKTQIKKCNQGLKLDLLQFLNEPLQIEEVQIKLIQ